MEGYDLTRTVPWAALSMMGFILIALPLLQIFVYMFIRRGYPGGYKGVFLGMASNFIICDVILSLVVLAERYIGSVFITGQENEALITSFKNIGQIIALLIECFVLVQLMEFSYSHFSYQAGTSKLGNALSFALGFSLVDTLQTTFSVFSNWVMGVSINGMGLSSFSEKLTLEEMESFLQDVEPLFSHGPFFYFSLFVERIVYAAFVIAIVAMLQLVTKKLLAKTFLINLTGIYCLYYVPALLRNMGLIKSQGLTVVFMMVITIFVCLMSWQVVKKTDPEDTEHLTDIWHGGLFKAVFGTMKSKKEKEKEKQTKAGSITKNAKM